MNNSSSSSISVEFKADLAKLCGSSTSVSKQADDTSAPSEPTGLLSKETKLFRLFNYATVSLRFSGCVRQARCLSYVPFVCVCVSMYDLVCDVKKKLVEMQRVWGQDYRNRKCNITTQCKIHAIFQL